MQQIAAKLDAYLLNIIQGYLTWQMRVITFTMHARIYAIYLNSKRCVLYPKRHSEIKIVISTFDKCQVIGGLRDLLAFMSLSSYTLVYFDEAREDLHIERGLISIGETRFGSIYWSLNSVLDGMPAFKRIMREQSLGIESEVRICPRIKKQFY